MIYRAFVIFFVGAFWFSWCSIAVAQQPDSLRKNKLFEVSFGQSFLFVSEKQLLKIREDAGVNFPTNSILFFVEFLPQKKIRVPVFFNLPTESRKFLINGQLVNEKVSPTFGTGLAFKIFQIKLNEESKIEFELGPLASFIFDNNDAIRFAPIIAGRVRLMRGDNFVMYFGGSYSLGINTLGILYGTGTVF